jgi:hypothetical protein
MGCLSLCAAPLLSQVLSLSTPLRPLSVGPLKVVSCVFALEGQEKRPGISPPAPQGTRATLFSHNKVTRAGTTMARRSGKHKTRNKRRRISHDVDEQKTKINKNLTLWGPRNRRPNREGRTRHPPRDPWR